MGCHYSGSKIQPPAASHGGNNSVVRQFLLAVAKAAAFHNRNQRQSRGYRLAGKLELRHDRIKCLRAGSLGASSGSPILLPTSVFSPQILDTSSFKSAPDSSYTFPLLRWWLVLSAGDFRFLFGSLLLWIVRCISSSPGLSSCIVARRVSSL